MLLIVSLCPVEQLVLTFTPIVSGTDMSFIENLKDKPSIMTFWQELYLREETSLLPFMKNASQTAGKREGAFDRVSGFLFLDMSFAPDSNKTIIAKAGELRLELFDRESASCSGREYKRLESEYIERVKKWHAEHDRMVRKFNHSHLVAT